MNQQAGQISQLIHHSAERFGGRPAVQYKDIILTYAELEARVQVVAAAYLAMGIGPGDRMAVYLPNQLETVVALFAACRAGAVLVPVNPSLKGAQVAHIMADCDVRLIVTNRARLDLLLPCLGERHALQSAVIVGPQAEGSDAVDGLSVCRWEDIYAGDPPPSGQFADRNLDDIAALFYTSGSTGLPKGVAVTHRNLIVGARSVAEYLGNRPEDRLLALPPFSFDYGFSQLTTAFAVGAAVCPMNFLLPRDVFKALVRYKITGLACVPPTWMLLAELDWPAEAVSTLRYITSTGGRMPHSLVMSLKKKLPSTEIFLMYGLTEAFRSTYLSPELIDTKPNSIGKAIPNAEIRVLRPDGSECDVDEVGELVHMGPLVAKGYWNDPERTARRFRAVPGGDNDRSTERAVWSGDLVTRDAEGFIYFVGRNDDMIKSSGYRISPTEIEEVVYRSGQVGECAAIGLDDERLGQKIMLAVTPRDKAGSIDQEALQIHCVKELPNYMQPREIVVLDDLPHNPNGKVDRGQVVELVKLQTSAENG